mmetsp:Transcript_45144/g.115493  ORF Transcript_45144/g.115493 Transcript_45144/m.115493 type:complete len:372 (-) Transcript_45144:209-1324(-)
MATAAMDNHAGGGANAGDGEPALAAEIAVQEAVLRGAAAHLPHAAAVHRLLPGAPLRARIPLCLAAWLGYADLASELLAAGAAPDVVTVEGYTSLSLACLQGHLAVVEALVAGGARLEHLTPAGSTPLSLAVRKGHAAVVTALVAAGAALDTPDAAGLTPLCVAVKHGHSGLVKLLLDAGARPEAHGGDGWGGGPSAKRRRVSFDRQPPKTDDAEPADTWGSASTGSGPRVTPLCLAAWTGSLRAVDALLSAGADVNCAAVGGVTPLFLASRGGHGVVASACLAAGADLEAATADGKTPLVVAVEECHRELALKLIEAGADCAPLGRLPPQHLVRLAQWQAELTLSMRSDHERLVYGIGHMLSAVRRCGTA